MSGRRLHNYSFGIGDRFGKEGCLLSAFLEMKKLGVSITPIWNKSHREHQTVGSRPGALVQGWSAEQFANCLRHQQEHPDYSPDFRQLLHTAYKIAAEKGDEFLKVLEEHRDLLEKNVVENILERHLKPLFL